MPAKAASVPNTTAAATPAAAPTAPTDTWDDNVPVFREPMVKIRCITHLKPHTGGTADPEDYASHRGMELDEVREVPEAVAEVLLKRKFVEKVA